ncbi:hypothetical protein [Pedobacter paludis]|uniref:Uncharacterized protein n=1 Tax=Pedobacter paludis TaxID=2203212 RepID=A0A317EY30_9SPHI|nr:hypothetical protein [Pedobacter paludis]PWS31880.1 hypothetical protein DF947_08770 [Pedobacter paludis]
MNTGEENNNLINPEKDKNENQNIEWDNGDPTYGHAVNPSSFKKKDAPEEEHLKTSEKDVDKQINTDLKNLNLANDSDVGNRNSENEKGIGGKSL